MTDVLKQFRDATGCNTRTAYLFLRKNKWDLVASYDSWSRLKGFVGDMIQAKLSHATTVSKYTEYVVPRIRDVLIYELNKVHLTNEDSILENNFFLPNFDDYDLTSFRSVLLKDLIDVTVLRDLEASKQLNWWCNPIQAENRLWPLITMGDGNCLLHAAAMSLCGIHDQFLLLRNALYKFLSNPNATTDSIKRRWRWHESKINLAISVEHTEEEWEKDWLDVVDSASSKKSANNAMGCYRGLESIHILCLAHVLRRVIIVIADSTTKDSHGQPLAPIYFGGIYIPFEIEEGRCSKNPLWLIYNNSHFSGLVLMEHKSVSEYYLPITQQQRTCLPIRFLVDPCEDFMWHNFGQVHAHFEEAFHNRTMKTLYAYLHIIDYAEVISMCLNFGRENNVNDQPEENIANNNIPKHLQHLGKNYHDLTKSPSPVEGNNSEIREFPLLCIKVNLNKNVFQHDIVENYIKNAREGFRRVECVNFCGRYGSESSNYLCSICFENQKEQLQSLESNDDKCFATGKSKFYLEPHSADYAATKNLPQPILKLNRTLYLSNSTFFNDTSEPFNSANNNVPGNAANNLTENAANNLGENLELGHEVEFTSTKSESKANSIVDFCFERVPSKRSEPGVVDDNCDTEGSNENVKPDNATHIQ